MQFLWPQYLWLLLALPLLVLLYVALLRRKKKVALRYASLSIVREDGDEVMTWTQACKPTSAQPMS